MNATLSAIADMESDPRRMPPPPSAWHDRGDGTTEEVPLVNAGFLQTCGTTALYIVASELEITERFSAESKDELIALILARTAIGEPPAHMLPPPLIPPTPISPQGRRIRRSMNRQVKDAVREMRRKPHGDN